MPYALYLYLIDNNKYNKVWSNKNHQNLKHSIRFYAKTIIFITKKPNCRKLHNYQKFRWRNLWKS